MNAKTSLLRQLILWSVIIFFGCAKQASPSGGERDTQGPILIGTTTAPFSTNTSPKNITFYFDENIQVKNPENTITISPLISPKPRFIKTNKSLTVLLNADSLMSNTTYSISLNNSISDLNEGNAFRPSVFIFSTGNNIDSQTISGEIIYSEKPKKDALKIWSIGEENNLVYTAKIDSSRFNIYGLGSATKNITVFNDENNNALPDPQEDIGFGKNIAPGNVPEKIYMYSRKKNTISTYYFNNKYYVNGISSNKIFQLQNLYPSVRTINDTLFADTATITQIKTALSTDYYILSSLIEAKPNRNNAFASMDIFDSVPNTRLYFHNNITSVTSDSTYLKIKSTDSVVKKVNTTHSKNYITLYANRNGELVIPAGAILFDNGTRNMDSISVSHAITNSVITLHNTNENHAKGYIEIDKIKYAFSLGPESKLSIYVSQGTYKLFYFFDTDNNSLLTPPKPEKLLEGEKWHQNNNVVADPKMANELILK